VPGGGIALDGKRWVSCRPGFFLPVRVLSRLFRRLFLDRLSAAHKQLQFFGNHTPLGDAQAFAAYLAPLRTTEGSVYQKRPFGGPEAVLAYLSRYTHRVAIANSRLIAFDQDSITFKWKDYRIEGRDRYKRMTLATDEFIRRFLIHVLPKGFHRIRHYGLLAKTSGADNIARARELLAGAPNPQNPPRRSRCYRPQPAGMSMLRRPHDHHRDLPARRDAAPSANRSHHQDRHFMTVPVPRRRKCACFVHWFSATSDGARPNVRLFCQTAQLPAQFGAPAAHSNVHSRRPTPRNRLVLNHAQHSRHSNPHSA